MCGAHFWRPVKVRLKEKEGKLEKMCIVKPWLDFILCVLPVLFWFIIIIIIIIITIIIFFFICYLAVSQPTLVHSREDNLINLKVSGSLVTRLGS